MYTKEEIVLNVLNEDKGIFAQLSSDDRKGVAGTITRILDAIEKSESDMKRKVASAEILAKLELMKEVGDLHDKLREIPFYKFSSRREMRFKILDLEAKFRYGGYFATDVKVPIETI
jgi:hypothetical protein